MPNSVCIGEAFQKIPMKTFILLIITFAAASAVIAADKPLLAIPGKVIYENKFDAAPALPWKAAKGKWELADGVWRGSEKPEDHHGAVNRLTNVLGAFVIEYEFRFVGAKSTSLSINAIKDHMARIMITPTTVTIQRDDNDHDGPDKAIVFARFPAQFATNTWHKVRMEMVGDTMLGRVDELTAWGSNDLFKQAHVAPGFTVGGQSVEFRNFSLREATLNPDWKTVKASLPKPGEKILPVASPKSKTKPKTSG